MTMPPKKTTSSIRELWQKYSKKVVTAARKGRFNSREVSQASVSSTSTQNSNYYSDGPKSLPSKSSSLSLPIAKSPPSEQKPYDISSLKEILELEADTNRPSPLQISTLKGYLSDNFPDLKDMGLEQQILLASRTDVKHRKASPEEQLTSILNITNILQQTFVCIQRSAGDISLLSKAPERAVLQLWKEIDDQVRCFETMCQLLQGHMQLEKNSYYVFPFPRKQTMAFLDQLMRRGKTMLHNSPAFREWQVELRQLLIPAHSTCEEHFQQQQQSLFEATERYFLQQLETMYPPLLKEAYIMADTRDNVDSPVLCHMASLNNASFLSTRERERLMSCLQSSPLVQASSQSLMVFESFINHLISDLYRSKTTEPYDDITPAQTRILQRVMDSFDIDFSSIELFSDQLKKVTGIEALMGIYVRLRCLPRSSHSSELLAIFSLHFKVCLEIAIREVLQAELLYHFQEKLIDFPDSCKNNITAEFTYKNKDEIQSVFRPLYNNLKTYQLRYLQRNEKVERDISQSGLNKADIIRECERRKKENLKDLMTYFSTILQDAPDHEVTTWIKQQELIIWEQAKRDFCKKLCNYTRSVNTSTELVSRLEPIYNLLGRKTSLSDWLNRRIPETPDTFISALMEMQKPNIG